MLETAWESRWVPELWGCSSVGRAPALQAGGRGFESLHLHCVSYEAHLKPLGLSVAAFHAYTIPYRTVWESELSTQPYTELCMLLLAARMYLENRILKNI